MMDDELMTFSIVASGTVTAGAKMKPAGTSDVYGCDSSLETIPFTSNSLAFSPSPLPKYWLHCIIYSILYYYTQSHLS